MMVKDGRGKYPQIVLKEPIHQNVTCLYLFIYLFFTITATGLFLQTTLEYVPVGALLLTAMSNELCSQGKASAISYG